MHKAVVSRLTMLRNIEAISPARYRAIGWTMTVCSMSLGRPLVISDNDTTNDIQPTEIPRTARSCAGDDVVVTGNSDANSLSAKETPRT